MNKISKNRLKRPTLWLGLIIIILLAVFSVYGAFIGPDAAKAFFNSLPLALYWLLFILVLIAAAFIFPRLLKAPSLLLAHAGCILVIAGALYGSNAAHRIRADLLGLHKIPRGMMAIYEGESENRVLLDDANSIKQLPFSIRLSDFRVEYYQPAYLYIWSSEGGVWKFPVELGKDFPLDDAGTVRILRTFENLKVTVADGNTVAIDAPQPGYNPALQVEFEAPDGTKTTQYVFSRLPGHTHPGDKFTMAYDLTVRDWLSDLQVIKDGKVVAEKTIEVNKPLHYGGYHFYQSDFDHENHEFTVLSVTSDSGLYCVFTGYTFLCIGVFTRFWRRKPTKPAEPTQ